MENCLQWAQTEKVHNRDLKDTETKICVESVVVSNAKHPTYADDVEVGSFVAWPIILLKWQ